MVDKIETWHNEEQRGGVHYLKSTNNDSFISGHLKAVERCLGISDVINVLDNFNLHK